MKLEKNEIRRLVKDYLQNQNEIIFAYIFGSFVNADDYRDIDIAVYIDSPDSAKDFDKYPYGYESKILGELTALLHSDKIDLVLLNKSPLLITHRIINRGELLFDKEKYMRIEFENFIRKQFIDNEYFRKIRTYYLKKKIGENA